MITEEKIKIFRRYRGDIDSWARSGSKVELSMMNDDDWFMVNELVQDLILVKKGLTSIEFSQNLETRLRLCCNNNGTIEELRKIATRG